MKKLYEIELERISEAGFGATVGGAAKESAKDFLTNPSTIKTNLAFSAGFALGIPLAVAIFRAMRGQLSAAHKRCGSMGDGPGYSLCVNKEKVNIYNGALQKLNSARAKCANNPKCINKIDSKIEEVRRGILIAQREIEELQKQIVAAKRENMSNKSLNEISIGTAASAAGRAATGAAKFTVGSIAVPMILFTMFDKMLQPIYKATRETFSAAEKQCSSAAEGPAKDMCKAQIKIGALQKTEAALNRIVTECNAKAGNNNVKCLKYINKLSEVRNQITAYKNNIEVYQQALRASMISK